MGVGICVSKIEMIWSGLAAAKPENVTLGTI